MGFRLAGHILETVTGVTPTQKLILLGLAERADGSGREAFPSNRTLARYAVCSGRNVELGLKQLRDAGWIGIQARATNRRPTMYYLKLEKLLGYRGEESSPEESSGQSKNGAESFSNSDTKSGRGEESSPLDAGGERTSPHTSAPEPRGEVSGTAGANFSAGRGEESSPRSDPGTDPRTDPETHTEADASFVSTEASSDARAPREAHLRAQFDRVWDVYPRGAAKLAAWKEFIRLNPADALVAEMLDAIEWQKRHIWGGVEPVRIPHLRTWLHQERWTDARDDVAPVSAAELARARQILSSKFLGRCPHPTPCPTLDDCTKAVALRERQHRRAS